MANFKAQYFFEVRQRKLAGWSRGFHLTADNLVEAERQAKRLLAPLYLCVGVEVGLPYLRVSDIDNFREVKLTRYLDSGTQNGQTALTADYHNTALLMKLKASGGYFSYFHLNAPFDATIPKNGIYEPTSAFQSRLTQFRKQLLEPANQFRIYAIPKTKQFLDIDDISQQGIVTCVAHGFDNNQRVRISRVKNNPQVNKVWRINAVTDDTFQLIGYQAPETPIPYKGDGVVKCQARQMYPITDIEVIGVGDRRAGRPFNLASGKRKSCPTM